MRTSTTSTKQLSFHGTICGRIDDNIVLKTTFVLKETHEVITNPILIAERFVIDSWRRFGADILDALPWDIVFFGNGSHSVI
ncbi:unnamed protein product [Rotaria sp. Silwood2]|nr:unnamed protein product [Rotaria sp. Silwood2]CAF3302409.1 unnamed protein product [Rotaria sp. Silwood2]CAF4136419.1 unnamed protein product [Rotaria sp. Silwood2]